MAGTIAAVGVSGIAGVSAVSAESDTASNDPMVSLVDKLVSKFNLNKDEVQSVFDESRAEMEAQREQRQAERLQELVEVGTITAEQKTAIEAKITELKEQREANKDSMQDLSNDERKAKMEEERASLESWAEEQGIDLSKLRGILMGGPGGHGGHFGGPPPERSSSDSK